MPSFPGPANGKTFVASNASPIALKPGDSVYVFGQLAATATQLPVNDTNADFEAAPADAAVASIAVQLPGAENLGAPAISVQFETNGAPGAGEQFEVQEADTHAGAYFITPANPAFTVSSFTANNLARVDLSPIGGKFVCVKRPKGANAVSAKVKITRLS